MGISVRQMLSLLNLSDQAVLGGIEGLDNEVSRVNMLEVPDVSQWLSGGELLLTTGYALKDDTVRQITILRELKDKGVAALGIKARRYLDPIPESMITETDRLGLPLIEIPAHFPLSEVMIPVYEALLNAQLLKLRKSQEMYSRFLDVILAGEGFDAICKVMFQLSGRPVAVIDRWGKIVGSHGTMDLSLVSLLAVKKAEEDENTFNSTIHSLVSDNGCGYFVLPICGRDRVWGYLVFPYDKEDLHPDDEIVYGSATSICILEFIKQQEVYQAEIRSRGELLEDLIYGNYKAEEAVIRRAQHSGFSLDGKLMLFIVDIISFEKYYLREVGKDEIHFKRLKNHILELTIRFFKDFAGGILTQLKSDSVIGLVHLNDFSAEKEFIKTASLLHSRIKEKIPEIQTTMGVGRSYQGVKNIPVSFEEAVMACKLGPRLSGGREIAFFENLGSYRCLAELKNSETSINFCKELIWVIEDYDQQHGTRLRQTLEKYFDCGGNLRQTAKELFIHRNSLDYRLRRIEELTGKKFSDTNDYFDFQFALRLSRLMG